MADERWLRLKAVHERVFELPLETARAIVLRELADDPALAHELISLLEQKLEGTSFLKFDDAPSRPSIFPRYHRLGEYELLHEIGRGGMGFVYMARHLPLERDVALKVLNPTLSARPEPVERFRREALRLAKFKNPGIVPIFDVQSAEGVHFFAMEYVDGLDLHRELVCQRKQLDSKTCRTTLPASDSKEYFGVVADLVRQAATALADAHDHQITHRDIKPHNLILGRDGRLRIVDFGIARDESMGRPAEPDDVSGTIYYMSPEQTRLSRKRVVDHRTDIYSLGVVMYELLTLQRPFDGKSQGEILKAIEVREPKPVRSLNARVPRDLAVICHTAMAKSPADRYANARELAADLSRFLAGEPIVAQPPTFVDRARRLARRHRVAVCASVVAVVAIAIGFYLRDATYADVAERKVVFHFAQGSAPVGLSFQVADPLTDSFGERVDLGGAPFESATVPAQFLRFRIVYADGVFTEHLRRVLTGEDELTIDFPARAADVGSNDGMVLIAGGVLERRRDPNGMFCSNLDHSIEIQPFWLDVHEVTVREFREFLQATGRTPPPNWNVIGLDPTYDNRPVVYVPYPDMQAYAEYHGKRLVTHAEWEWAARGSTDRLTPTGAPISPTLRATIHGDDLHGEAEEELAGQWRRFTSDVGTSADDLTPEGVHDMLGNVCEATGSAMVDTRAVPQGAPQLMSNCFWHLGGAWYYDNPAVGLDAHAFDGVGTVGSPRIGFRCARSATR